MAAHLLFGYGFIINPKDKALKSLLKYTFAFILLFASISLIQTTHANKLAVLFQEDFNNLDNWKPLYFPKIKNHSKYSIESTANDNYLKTKSQASASAIVYKKEFNVYKFPKVAWQWRVDNVYKKGNPLTKDGDDYPLRIYIMFKYDPAKAGFLEKAKYTVAKLMYGEYPPHSTLNYAWANKWTKKQIITSPYTEQAKMILTQKGRKNLGKWVTQEVNVVKDYKEAFGEAPPAIASIAIMNDSDNTEESSTSYINYIRVYNSTE